MLIRKKLLISTVLLVTTLVLLLLSSLQGVLAYRRLTMSIGALSYEFQEMWEFGQDVGELRRYVRETKSTDLLSEFDIGNFFEDRDAFSYQLHIVRSGLNQHIDRIEEHMLSDPLLSTSEAELQLAFDMKSIVASLENAVKQEFDLNPSARVRTITRQLNDLETDTQTLFDYMTDRMRTFRGEMRSRYHGWIAAIVATSSLAFTIVGLSFWFFRRNVVQPFKILLNGSRMIARDNFEHRIHLNSHDELAELAEVQNKMTDRFVEIRDHLNEKVQQRTREVVRSEQLASVGFLAAGVAHEINNPLASIAWSAEALESRLHELLHGSQQSEQLEANQAFDEQQIEVLRRYLRRIQDEAFRCKGITERLLDFSRLGEAHSKQSTDIDESVSDVIALVKHLGQYRNKTINYSGVPGTIAWVSPTEFKQVILNLLTNSLDAVDDGGVVSVTASATENAFSVTVEDDGCGMTPEVMQHLFEPFFTRRRDGRGTGLGLSITYRIVQDHCGTLVPSSPGPGRGSKFVLTIPLQLVDVQDDERLKAAA